MQQARNSGNQAGVAFLAWLDYDTRIRYSGEFAHTHTGSSFVLTVLAVSLAVVGGLVGDVLGVDVGEPAR